MLFKDLEDMLYHFFNTKNDVKEVLVNLTDGNVYHVASSRGIAKIVYNNEKKKVLHLFLKSCTQGTVSDTLNKSLKLFDKEKYFYTNIFPIYKSLTNENMFLGFYGMGKTSSGTHLIFDDFSKINYKVPGKKEFHSLNLIKNVMKNLAVFHASYFYVDSGIRNEWKTYLEDLEIFLPCHQELLEGMFGKRFQEVCRVLEAVNQEVTNNNTFLLEHCLMQIKKELLAVVASFNSKQIMNVFLKCVLKRTDFSCLCHGDFHMWNITVSQENDENIKFFDYQVVRFASLVTDILQYLYQVSSPDFRTKHVKDILETYCVTFNEFCKRNNIKKYFDSEELYKEYLSLSMWGFMYGFNFILPKFMADDFFKSIENVADAKEIAALLIEKAEGNEIWKVLSMYHDMLIEASDIGTFVNMKKMIEE